MDADCLTSTDGREIPFWNTDTWMGQPCDGLMDNPNFEYFLVSSQLDGLWVVDC